MQRLSSPTPTCGSSNKRRGSPLQSLSFANLPRNAVKASSAVRIAFEACSAFVKEEIKSEEEETENEEDEEQQATASGAPTLLIVVLLGLQSQQHS